MNSCIGMHYKEYMMLSFHQKQKAHSKQNKVSWYIYKVFFTEEIGQR